MIAEAELAEILVRYEQNRHTFEQFRRVVLNWIELEPGLATGNPPLVHSTKSRLKETSHLVDKVHRKVAKGREITAANVFDEITDLCGVRILHLFPSQMEEIHEKITKKIATGDWLLDEDPVAYTWDPESAESYNRLGITPKVKETYYTSVHYVVRPATRERSPVSCELQVRTLFEEVWGEIDHACNYPHPSESLAVTEQIRVLAKLVSTGTRLADAIHRVREEHAERSKI